MIALVFKALNYVDSAGHRKKLVYATDLGSRLTGTDSVKRQAVSGKGDLQTPLNTYRLTPNAGNTNSRLAATRRHVPTW